MVKLTKAELLAEIKPLVKSLDRVIKSIAHLRSDEIEDMEYFIEQIKQKLKK